MINRTSTNRTSQITRTGGKQSSQVTNKKSNFFKSLYNRIKSSILERKRDTPQKKSIQERKAVQIDKKAVEETPHNIDTSIGRISLSKQMLPKVAKSSKIEQEQILQKIGEKIDAGHKLYKAITGAEGGSFSRIKECSMENVTNLMWFLKAKAEGKAGPHKKGAISIEDPGGEVRNFLDQNLEKYQRRSSHIEGFQKGNIHRGIDFNKTHAKTITDLDNMLPYGMKTILYGSMPKDTLGMPKNMLFIKMETHGTALAKPKGGIIKEIGSRKINIDDIGNTLGHALALLKSKLRKTYWRQL